MGQLYVAAALVRLDQSESPHRLGLFEAPFNNGKPSLVTQCVVFEPGRNGSFLYSQRPHVRNPRRMHVAG